MADPVIQSDLVPGRNDEDITWLLYVALGIVTYNSTDAFDDEDGLRLNTELIQKFTTALQQITSKSTDAMDDSDRAYVREAWHLADAVYKIEWDDQDDS